MANEARGWKIFLIIAAIAFSSYAIYRGIEYLSSTASIPSLEGIRSVRIISDGDVYLTGSDQPYIDIMHTRSRSVEKRGSELYISIQSDASFLRIGLPDGFDISIHSSSLDAAKIKASDLSATASGDISMIGLDADSISAYSAEGSILIQDSAAASIEASAHSDGTVTISEANADTIHASSENGDMNLDFIKAASIKATTYDGNISVQDTDIADAIWESGFGSASVKGIAESKGSFKGESGCTLELKSRTGTITII